MAEIAVEAGRCLLSHKAAAANNGVALLVDTPASGTPR